MPETTLWLYSIQPTRPEMLVTGPTPEEDRIIDLHFDYLQRLFAEGVALHVGRTLATDASAVGLAILRAESAAEARALLAADPAVAGGVMRGQVAPYRVIFGPAAWK